MLCAHTHSNLQPPPSEPAHRQRQQDAALVARLVADEPRAWREFNALYSRRMYRAITRVTSRFTAVVTPDDVREIYAILCLQLLANGKAKLRSFDPDRGSSLASWLGLLASHAAYDFLRSRKREPRSEEITEVDPVAAAQPSPYDLCEVRQRARVVAGMLESFTERDQRFIELYFGEGMDPDRIARMMGISVKTVYSKKHKIQTKLEGLLGSRALAV